MSQVLSYTLNQGMMRVIFSEMQAKTKVLEFLYMS